MHNGKWLTTADGSTHECVGFSTETDLFAEADHAGNLIAVRVFTYTGGSGAERNDSEKFGQLGALAAGSGVYLGILTASDIAAGDVGTEHMRLLTASRRGPTGAHTVPGEICKGKGFDWLGTQSRIGSRWCSDVLPAGVKVPVSAGDRVVLRVPPGISGNGNQRPIVLAVFEPA